MCPLTTHITASDFLYVLKEQCVLFMNNIYILYLNLGKCFVVAELQIWPYLDKTYR